jgi:hypothetical protein
VSDHERAAPLTREPPGQLSESYMTS